MKSAKAILFVLLCFLGKAAHGQLDSLTSRLMQMANKKLLVIPGVTYSPETSWVFGLASVYRLEPKWKDSTDRESYLKFTSTYSLRNQFSIELGGRVASRKEKFVVFGEVGYKKYPNKFYGIGNEISYDSSEQYTPRSIRVRLNGLYQIRRHLYVGPRLQMDNVLSLDIESNGILDDINDFGEQGGRALGLGYVVNSDSRNSVFGPTQGHFFELRQVFFKKAIGSEFNFDMLQYDLRKYFKVKKKHVLALQHYGHYTWGDVPFFQLPTFGGPYRMRGHFNGAYQDKNALLFQADFRYRLGKYFVWSTFGGLGWVSHDFSKFHWPKNRISVGTGLRLYPPGSTMAFRLDYGWARNHSAFYLGVGEAF